MTTIGRHSPGRDNLPCASLRAGFQWYPTICVPFDSNVMRSGLISARTVLQTKATVAHRLVILILVAKPQGRIDFGELWSGWNNTNAAVLHRRIDVLAFVEVEIIGG